MSNTADSILIFTSNEPTVPSSGEAPRGSQSVIKNATNWFTEVTVNTLQENMCQFLSNLDQIISTSPKEVGGLTLDEVEIHVQIDGKGNIGITGIVSSELAAQGGIKFVLRKKV